MLAMLTSLHVSPGSHELCPPVKIIHNYVPGLNSVSEKSRDIWRSALRKVQQWVYSWMKPGYVEDEDELKISKFLLLQLSVPQHF